MRQLESCEVAFVLVSILGFWLITINRSPNILRPLSMLARTGYTVVIPCLYAAFYLVFRLKGWTGSFLSLFLTLSVFALALAGAWATGLTESGLLSGVIPMFDSATYYADSLRLLAGKEFSPSSTSRPIFMAFFSLLLWIANHNLLQALALLTLLVSLACYFLAREINGTHGAAIAAFVLVFIFVYYRYHSGVVRTENLGFLFGVLGTALLWSGIARGQKLYLLAGIFVTSLGIITRAGAFFILPLLVLWGSISFKKNGERFSWQFLLGGLLAIAIAFLANQWIMKSFGARDVIPFGNFSYSLYGLASGGHSWADVLKLYPAASQSEIYRMAFRLILEQPHLFVKGVLYNYSMFFSPNTNYGLFSYMRGEGNISALVSYWVLLPLSLLGIWHWYRNRNDPFLGFVMVLTSGLLLSVPFLPPTDAFRLRVYATSVVVLALFPGLGLYALLTYFKLERWNPKEISRSSGGALVAYTSFVVMIVLIGPFAVRYADALPMFKPTDCEPGLAAVVVRYDEGNMVHFVPQTTPLLDWAPLYHIGTLRSNLHDFPNFPFMDWGLANIGPRNSMFYALDYRSFRGVLVRAEALLCHPRRLCSNSVAVGKRTTILSSSKYSMRPVAD
jgi:hypothetical protein